jgi:hypothetical protein
MKNLIFFISLLILSSGNILAQNKVTSNSSLPLITWQETFGGSGREYGTCIINTLDKAFAVTGHTTSTGSGMDDIFIVKLYPDGSLNWSYKIGGETGEIANSLIQTSDSCFIIVGATYSSNPDFCDDMLLIKLTSNGELIWAKTFGSEGWDIAYSVKQTYNGGFIVVGYSEIMNETYGLTIVKFRGDGTIEWSKFADKVGISLIYPEIIQTYDEGFGIATTIDSVFGNGDMCFIKLNELGLLQWSWAIGGPSVEEAVSVCQTGDNGYALSGYTASYGAGAPDLYIVKLAQNGDLQWTRTIGGNNDDYAFSIMNSHDGGFIVAGESFSYSLGWIDMYLIKLDHAGRYVWGKTAGGSEMDFIRSAVYDYDGGFVAVGRTDSYGLLNSDMYIVKSDSNGNTCGNTTTPVPHIDSGGTIVKYPIIIYDVSTTLTSVNPNITMWGSITNLCLTEINPSPGIFPQLFSLRQNYPNPFNPVTKIEFDIPENSNAKIIIYDLLGREVTTLINEQLKPGSYSVDWDGTGFASGVYFYSLITNEFTETKRMVLIK